MQSLMPKIESQLSALAGAHHAAVARRPAGQPSRDRASRWPSPTGRPSPSSARGRSAPSARPTSRAGSRSRAPCATWSTWRSACCPAIRRRPTHGWWSRLQRRAKSRGSHSLGKDAEQIEFHYDVSDDFYALWLDPRRVYSCAYFRDAGMTLAQAQEAKLDHICRKLMLQPGERFLDIGSGWGALLLWAAEHYGVDATGITLSKNQHAYVTAADRGEGPRRAGCAWSCATTASSRRTSPSTRSRRSACSSTWAAPTCRTYFRKIHALLEPGGLVMNHGITSGQLDYAQLGAGMGDFIEKYIFPGGELLHVTHVLRETAAAGLEMVDTENLRPHYARTLWALVRRARGALRRGARGARAHRRRGRRPSASCAPIACTWRARP